MTAESPKKTMVATTGPIRRALAEPSSRRRMKNGRNDARLQSLARKPTGTFMDQPVASSNGFFLPLSLIANGEVETKGGREERGKRKRPEPLSAGEYQVLREHGST